MPDQLHQLRGLHGAGPVHLLQDQCGSHVPGTWAGQQCQGVHAVLLWIQLHLVPGQLLQLQGLQAAGPVHLQVQCGSLHVCGAWAGQHCQGDHAGLSPTRSKSWTPSWSSLSRDMLLTLLGFSPSTWVPQPLLFSSLLQPPDLFSKFSSCGPRSVATFLQDNSAFMSFVYKHRCAGRHL